MEPARTIGRRIGLRGDVATFAEELDSPTQKMSSVFPQSQLLENHVYILVDLPPGEPIVVVLTVANCSRLLMSFEIVIRRS